MSYSSIICKLGEGEDIMSREVKPLSHISHAQAQRIYSGLFRGYSASQSAGHAKKNELTISEIEKVKAGKTNDSILIAAVKSKNPELIKEYNLAKKEKFAKSINPITGKKQINDHIKKAIEIIQAEKIEDYDFPPGETPIA